MSKTTDNLPKSSVSTIHELQDAARQFRIITSGEDIIQRTGEQVVRACQLQMSVAAWQQNFDLMVQHVEAWCKERADRVLAALVALRSDKIVFYIIPKSEGYDFGLGREQADLDIHMNTRGGIGYAETRQVPRWEFARFVPHDAFRVWPRD